jgi:hypothetical protein
MPGGRLGSPSAISSLLAGLIMLTSVGTSFYVNAHLLEPKLKLQVALGEVLSMGTNRPPCVMLFLR